LAKKKSHFVENITEIKCEDEALFPICIKFKVENIIEEKNFTFNVEGKIHIAKTLKEI